MQTELGYDMINGAGKELIQRLHIKSTIKLTQHKSASIGCSICIVLETEHGCLFGGDGLVDFDKKSLKNINYFRVWTECSNTID